MADAEIIAVGSEMLTSQRIDTNSLYITDQLNALGVEVRRKLIVGDDRALLADAVRSALEHAGLVILTGGLGPTEDDVTRQAVADALSRELVFSQDICDEIEERFRRRQRKMAEINKRQAYLVEGAEILPNANGTAPGQWIANDGRIVIMLPGPPGELKPLFANECIPRLTKLLPAQVIRARFYRVTGFTESDLDALIAPVYTKYSNPATTILASPGDIQIHLRARCGSAEDAERLLAEVGDPIEELLGKHLFSRNGDPLEAIVGTLLRERGATLSVAESCTGGMVGERVTSVAGSSDYFLGGFVTYTDRLKIDLLGVDPALITQHTAVSKEAARAMAEGARTCTGSTFAISITGEAGPESSTGSPVGTIFVGFAGPDGPPEALRFSMPGDRPRIRGFATQAALDLLRRRLLKLD
ncbi:MAG TPA: competence/damage-inducible protein A [Bryobacteraceae bacterium]|jgi:nicotinamide-nucleotide amidase|nr:competence/damage-inducible protein A [Bryobacteraceae bacterium]